MDIKKEKEEKKRNRGENWTPEDKALLQELVRHHVAVLENKNTDTNTNRSKQKAWADVQNSFNEMCCTKRTTTQLKAQWSIIKMTAKKEKSKQRIERFKTGGGPQVQQTTVTSDDIESWLPNEFVVDYNSFDSDKDQEVAQAKASDEMPFEEFAQQITFEDDGVEEVEIEAAVEEVGTENEQMSIETKKTSRKRKQKPSASNAASAIADFEIKCRKELHELQMKNEEKKSRNLDLEQEVLVAKLNFYKNKRF